jgi:hypothetical protein
VPLPPKSILLFTPKSNLERPSPTKGAPRTCTVSLQATSREVNSLLASVLRGEGCVLRWIRRPRRIRRFREEEQAVKGHFRNRGLGCFSGIENTLGYCYGKNLLGRNMAGIAERPEEAGSRSPTGAEIAEEVRREQDEAASPTSLTRSATGLAAGSPGSGRRCTA